MKKTILIMAVVLATSCTGQPETKKEKGYTDREAIETILSRKSVRSYLDKPVEQEKIDLLTRAGMAAPFGRGEAPWEIFIVDDKEILSAMAKELKNAPYMDKAPMAIIVGGNSEKSFYWYLECAAVTQNILLASEALDLGAVWTASYPYEDRMEVVKKYIKGIPDNIHAFSVIPVGYPDKKVPTKSKYDESKIHLNKW